MIKKQAWRTRIKMNREEGEKRRGGRRAGE